MTAQQLFFFDIRPLRASPLLVFLDPQAKLIIPHMGRSHVDGIGTQLEGQLFGILALARAGTAGNQYYFLHTMQ